MENKILDEDNSDFFINFPPEVQKAIDEVLPNKDSLDEPDFNSIDYINSLFPTEQSLSNIDEMVIKMENQIHTIDNDISTVIQSQIEASVDGREALGESQKIIKQLFLHIKDIKERAEKSEEMVREITRDIKQLDCAKRNLTLAITTLNHLHMLVGGVDTLKSLTEKHLYGEIALPLQAISEVMTHFEHYSDIPQIKKLSDQVKSIHTELADQITHDFKDAFQGANSKNTIPSKQLQQACLVVSILNPKVKKDLLKWFITLELQEYSHLFQETEDTAWLDKIDKRYAWVKRHLLEFEEKLGRMFPENWEVSERIAVQFCHHTREELSKIMAKRKNEIDVKLLLYAIQKTSAFENLLFKRFTGATVNEGLNTNHLDEHKKKTEKHNNGAVNNELLDFADSPFNGLIGRCFIPYLDIYIESLDRNLSDLIDRFVQDEKQHKPIENAETQAAILPSCPDLFVFYKKSMIQCTQLDRGQSMLSLTRTFQKYLQEYSEKLLYNNLPKIECQSLGSSVQNFTKDLQKISTSGLIQNFSSLLKEGEMMRFAKDEQTKICCILTTAEYCLETTQQLQDKLKEKIDATLADQIDLSKEQDLFHKVISNCIQLLVQDLENACEPSLTAMSKIPWQNIDAVGDQSPYITSITMHLKTTIPIIRDSLAHSRKYFTQFCIKFANSFIPKFIQNIYKCKPINTEGAEQLLLDTHMLKTVLLNLPSISSQINRTAPAAYSKVVTKGMTKAEMILKIVMTPIEPQKNFVEQCKKLFPECQLTEFHKMLDMKNIKRQEQAILIDLFKSYK
ncbi:vacuolar protein sorting-associated protein 53 homolog [Sitophilus oryzae]|uniref:Vacuolar protein sorting-associated protein 53 homolog n=1 Tax=Sitophilus oryzae TaxID=7048 RepID=A0A6J2XSB1_SITOR|nr:vacuolar protein sorting-associated protein 53 homolog [Sitophilus oryzae]XP_030753643.1 vacuolar protein sorting-associated protein 53 homolog [Sitophilus oryzae]XP_030753725.1 vacuolar protein sorting-associated protein 53 homolog [Sitophilus oryzae]